MRKESGFRKDREERKVRSIRRANYPLRLEHLEPREVFSILGFDFQQPELWVDNFGQNTGGWNEQQHLRLTGDVSGDGRPDVVGFGDNGVYVSLSTGTSFTQPQLWVGAFGYNAGGWRTDQHPRMLADVNGDDRADVVGFGNNGVYVSLSRGTSFAQPQLWVGAFGYNAGGWRTDQHPRMLADVNGDDRADVVGFGNNGVYVSLSRGTSFAQPQLWVGAFGYNAGGWRTDQHPRMLADVNGDDWADVVGFGNNGVYVSLSEGTSFAQPQLWVGAFGYNAGGWRQEKHPRMLADVNGDDRADVVGFADDGVYVSLSTGTSLTQPQRWVSGFGYVAGGWRTDRHPRMVADVNGDHRADVVGFGNGGVYVALSRGTSFTPSQLLVNAFGYNAGAWRTDRHPRMLEDVNRDGLADVVGFSDAGVMVSLGEYSPPQAQSDFEQPELWIDSFGQNTGGWNEQQHLRLTGDVSGDGRPDVVGFGDNGVYVSLSTGTSFTQPQLWVGAFGYNAGGWRTDQHPRMLADVNGDDRADVVGFGNNGVYVSLSRGTSFAQPQLWVGAFGYNAGGWRTDQHPRMLADVNGDHKDDVVGFGNNGVYVSLSRGTSFAQPQLWVGAFGYNAGGWRTDQHPRMLADVNGDDRADVVGFGNNGVYVSLSRGTSFAQPQLWVGAFGYNAGGWRQEKHPRMLADVNGDDRADVVGFADDGVYVSLSTGTSLTQPQRWVSGFGYVAGGWRTDRHPRMVADVNGDHLADVVGFGNGGVHVALSRGTSFAPSQLWVDAFGYNAGGWRTDRHPRMLADVNRDGLADVVGFSDGGVMVSLAESLKPGFQIDLVFNGVFTQGERAALYDAAERWTDIIIGDLPRVTTSEGFVDDIEILMTSAPIDGISNILGFGVPTGLRTDGSYLPYRGNVTFDTPDLGRMLSNGSLSDLAFHEIGHVLGFGTIWGKLGLIRGAGTTDPRFLGAAATAEYNTLFGVIETGVPVENTGGKGTQDVHWRESVFADEMMTGFFGTDNRVSRITIGAILDLGYIVDLSRAEAYAPRSGSTPNSGADPGTGATSWRRSPWSAADAATVSPVHVNSLHAVDRPAVYVTDRAIAELTSSDFVLQDRILSVNRTISGLAAEDHFRKSGNDRRLVAVRAANEVFVDDNIDLIGLPEGELPVNLG